MTPGYRYECTVQDVYDGDTVFIDFDLGLGVRVGGEGIRLLGIDTPELRGSERPDGLRVRDFVREVLARSPAILIDTVPAKGKRLRRKKELKGKFGRWLGVLWVQVDDQWVNLNELLLANGMAKPYPN